MRRWDFRLVPIKRSLEAMAYLPELHIISRAEGVDLFPLTSAVVKMAIFEQKCSLANPVYRRAEFDINVEQSSHVETVALLTRKAR